MESKLEVMDSKTVTEITDETANEASSSDCSFVHRPPLTVKLDGINNHFLWKNSVLDVLRKQRVDDFVLGTNSQPSEFSMEQWKIIDQDLCGWLFGSMTEAVAADLVGLSSSRELWKALEQMYGETSRARIDQMCDTLRNTKKGSMSMIQYLSTMKEASEDLGLAGAPVSISDLTSYVLGGLEPEVYIPIVRFLEAQEISEWKHLRSLLVAFEESPEYFVTNLVSSNRDFDLLCFPTDHPECSLVGEFWGIVHIDDPERTQKVFRFAGNSIRTAKYSILTFLPMNLFEQFHRIAYVYFLVLAVLSQLPQLAVFGPGVSIFPLATVLLVAAVKDAYEDWTKHRSDNFVNNRSASVLINGRFQDKKWKDIRVGEIVKVHDNETIPCDMVLLSTSDPTGVASMRTLNLDLDGDSTFKTACAMQETMSKRPEEEKISGSIRCGSPSRYNDKFEAVMEIDGKRRCLGISNLLLRGCELKNTRWAVGVVVYAGRETKALLNSSSATSKRSRLEKRTNVEIIILFFLLSVLCIVVSVCSAVWFIRKGKGLDNLPYFRKKDFSRDPPQTYKYYGRGLDAFFAFLMSAIVLQIMVPISLYISMDFVRLGQAYFMIRDVGMYDETTNSRLQCRTLSVNESLGQIRHVFSNQTGTLTENKMEFRCASIGGINYEGEKTNPLGEQIGYSIQVNGKVLRPKMEVKINSELLRLLKSGKHTDEARNIHNFFLALAACNTVFPLITETSDPSVRLIEYRGKSSDEMALVYAAAAYGFMLIERTAGHIVINVHGEKHRYNILGVHDFDSSRERMSVILECPDRTFKVFVKGADTSMFNVMADIPNMDTVQATKAHLRSYSLKGLRTLVIGMKELSPSDFEKWHLMFKKASTALNRRNANFGKVANSIENNLSILGASCTGDKLQKGVPEAFESLRTAGIKVWVLTGDKQENVVSIGYSSGLLTNKMLQIIVNSHSVESCRRILENATIMSKKFASVPGATLDISGKITGMVTNSIALIIYGNSLDHILGGKLEEQFFELACCCSVVLCCRVSRSQKAKIVSLVKRKTSDMTLAIGDGVHDVPMIQKADVGIGISGKEGQQAVMASDFAIGQFRFLVPLLLVHGHWNYQRMSYMILHIFYRNVVFVFVLFWYVLFTSFSLTTAINQWSNVLYSIISTCFPSMVVGILDKDLGRRTLLRYPQLYGAGHRQEGYNSTLFWLTMIDAVWQSITIFFIPLLAYWATTIDVSSLGDLWLLALVIVVNLHLAMDIVQWNFIIHAVIWGSIFATVISVIVLDSLVSLPGYWAIYHAAGTVSFWLCLLAIIVVALLPRFVVKCVYQYWSPSDIQVAREADKFGRTEELGDVQTSNRDDPSPQ